MIKKYRKIRIDTVNQDLCQKLCDLYSPDCYMWNIEDAGTDNQHSHFYVEFTCTEETVRKWIRKNFGKGNQVWSMSTSKEEKPIEYLAYCVKQGKYFYRNLDIDKYIAYDDKIKKELKDKKSTKKSKTVFSKICDDYVASTEYETVKQTANWQYLAKFVINWHLKEDKQLAEFRIKGYVQTLACKYHDYTNLFAAEIVKNF